MKNIESILAELGIAIPEDKAEAFKTEFEANYKTVAEVDKLKGKLTTAQSETEKWKASADSAAETLKSFEGIDPAKVKEEIAAWQKKAEQAESDYEAKLAERERNEALDKALEAYKFTSSAAKSAVANQVRALNLSFKDGAFFGLTDAINSIREADKGAFVDEEAQELEQSKVTITSPKQTTPSGGSSIADILAIKDRDARRKAIADNPQLFS